MPQGLMMYCIGETFLYRGEEGEQPPPRAGAQRKGGATS
jgi:hypothetical protein